MLTDICDQSESSHLSRYSPGQAGKLECILHYFEALADEGEPVGDIVFHRQVSVTEKQLLK